MNNLPITNKKSWKEIRGGATKPLGINTIKSQFICLWDFQIETMDCVTIHYGRKNYEMEGIKIRWNGNPFKITHYANTTNKVYE